MVETRLGRSSAAPALAQLVAAGLLGLVVLPALLGGKPATASALVGLPGGQALLWLLAGLLVAVWLLAAAPGLARALAGLLYHLEVGEGSPGYLTADRDRRTAALARWLVAVGYVLLVQAILRRPFVTTLGVLFEPSTVEAAFGAAALALLLVALYWLHRAARPVIEKATWQALDAIVATSGAEAPGRVLAVGVEPAAAMAARAVGARRPAMEALASGESTRPASTRPSTGGGVTQLADATVEAPEEATRPADVAAAGEATELVAAATEPDDASQPPARADDAEATCAEDSSEDETRPAGRGARLPVDEGGKG